MKLQYNNLEELDLGAVETAITNAVEKPITFLDNFDATNIQKLVQVIRAWLATIGIMAAKSSLEAIIF